MPKYRLDLESIPRYIPGQPIEEVARELGITTSILKLASNECPTEPLPEVLEAIVTDTASLNRYPDSSQYALTDAIAVHHGIDPASVWVGAGSSEILRCTALSLGGPGSSAVFAHPSFVMYVIATLVAHADPISVPLDDNFDHDLDAMLEAVRDDTTIVYLCNPNNPTGAIRSGEDVRAFIDTLDDEVTVIVDEAYAEYVTDPIFESMIQLASTASNVLVARTFSKVYGLAGLRVGYGIGHPDLIDKLRITQAPFAVTTLAQASALEALKHQPLVTDRVEANAAGRTFLTRELAARGYDVVPSQANFVYFEPQAGASAMYDALLLEGVIARVLGRGMRVTVGTESENRRFVEALDKMGAS